MCECKTFYCEWIDLLEEVKMAPKSIVMNIVKNNKFYYGWIVTAIASLGVFFSGPGQTYFVSIFIDSYISDFGWNRGIVSSLYSAATLLSGLSLFIVGRFIDRYGQRRMTLVVAALLGFACLWNSFISSLWMLFLGFFLGRVMGQGSMTLIPSTIVPQWFIRRRAFALSLMSVGGVVGSASIPPFNAFLINTIGWHHTWRFWALILWFFFIPVVYFFQYNKPEDIGLLPDNEKVEENKPLSIRKESTSWTLKEAFHERVFWFMLFCQQIVPMISTGVIFHFVSVLATKGLDSGTSSYVLSIIALANFPTTLLSGFILDKIKIHFAVVVTCLLQLTGLIILLLSSSIIGAMVFAAFQGMALGLNTVCNGVVWPNYFGIKHLGNIRGVAMTAMVIGTSFGPLPLGILYDLFGRYNEAIIFMMLFPFMGAIMALMSPKPIKRTS